MNEIRRPSRETDAINRIREIVGRHVLPDFVVGFDVTVGDFDGEPAAWITFYLTGSDQLPIDELQRRAEHLVNLQRELTPEILVQSEERFPFFRSDYRADASRI